MPLLVVLAAVVPVMVGCQPVELVSGPPSTSVDGSWSSPIDATPDGRYVLFNSTSSDLVSGDTNGATDAFLRDNSTGVIERVSLDADGSQIAQGAGGVGLTDDGSAILLVTRAALTAEDTDAALDGYVRRRDTGAIVLASIPPSGTNPSVMTPDAISGDGRFVTVNGAPIFVRDLVTGTSVTVGSFGGSSVRMSDDGETVAYVSSSPWTVHVWRRGVGVIFSRVVLDEWQMPEPYLAVVPAQIDLSADGRYLALSAVEPWTTDADLEVHDFVTGEVRTVPDAVAPPGDGSFEVEPSLSDDGRWLQFRRWTGRADDASDSQVLLHDLLDGTTTVVDGDVDSNFALLSDGGRWSLNLTAAGESSSDTDGQADVYLRDAHIPVVTAVAPASLAPGVHVVHVTVTGAWEIPEVSVSGDGVTVGSVNVVDGGLEVEVTVAPGAAAGPRDVRVVNPRGWDGPRSGPRASGRCIGCLTING